MVIICAPATTHGNLRTSTDADGRLVAKALHLRPLGEQSENFVGTLSAGVTPYSSVGRMRRGGEDDLSGPVGFMSWPNYCY